MPSHNHRLLLLMYPGVIESSGVPQGERILAAFAISVWNKRDFPLHHIVRASLCSASRLQSFFIPHLQMAHKTPQDPQLSERACGLTWTSQTHISQGVRFGYQRKHVHATWTNLRSPISKMRLKKPSPRPEKNRRPEKNPRWNQEKPSHEVK